MVRLLILAACLRRDWTVQRTYRVSFALMPVSVFFELAMFFYLGRIVDRADFEATGDLEHGYFSFVVIGTTTLELITLALLTCSANLHTEQTTGALEALLATPAPPAFMIMAGGAFGYIQATLSQLFVVLMAGLVFGLRIEAEPAALLAALLAFTTLIALFAALGLVLAAFTLVVKRGANTIAGYASSVLGLLGGVYFPLAILPGPLRLLGQALPLTWGVDVLRAALLEGDVLYDRLGLLLVSLVVAVPISLWIFGLGLDRARRDGSLAQY